MPDDAPKKVRPYLDKIASRLWSNSAAVMVGAGFSRNAKPLDSTVAPFPSWQELGDTFYAKLHGHSPDEETKYLSLLKLAEQVQAAFGSPALDELLRRAIPDLGYEPSPLHSQLLNLPWKDVFTTNFDTLLERARASVTLKNYDVVATEEDLLYANTPRIVKLHGSFPSAPFVITEEDYRRYPDDHAPFVNTVRQSLIENTLCLIGFSGDDPNFLQWIGWMRDHLGKEIALNIYLVGVLDELSEADRKLLDGRGIVAVDLSEFSSEPSIALGGFLDYLKDARPRAADWPRESANAPTRSPETSIKEFAEIAAEWCRQRREYPGWVVVPEGRRQILWDKTVPWLSRLSHTLQSHRNRLETPLDLNLAYEFAWRVDRCLFQLYGELPTFLEEVATKYSSAGLRLSEESGWTETSAFEAVSKIRLWLLRHYREEGMDEEWQAVRQAVNDNFARLPPDLQARFRLEEALQALFQFDPAEAKRLLVNWQNNDSPPFWEAKRASLMAELGEAGAARSILEASLSAIRQQQSLSPVIDDYTLVSQESVVMLLLWAVERGLAMTELRSGDSNLWGELSERRNELTRYKCDPWAEIESLSARLRHPSEGWRQEHEAHSFDLGMVSRTYRFGSDEEAIVAFGLLRLYEDIGLPYRMESATFVKGEVESTFGRVRPYSRHLALVNFVRLGDAKAADRLFDREFLASLSQDEANRFMDIYLLALERTISMAGESDWSSARTFEALAKTLPEVLSRLCYKGSPAYRTRLVRALSEIYGSTRNYMFEGVHQFARRLFDSMSIEERARMVPSLVEVPFPEGLPEIKEREFINPLLFVDLHESARGMYSVSPERIDQLLVQLAEDPPHRDWTATTIARLHHWNKLDDPQSERLGELLWDGFAASGMPVVKGLRSFACMKLPHPAEIDPEPRVKKHLRVKVDAAIADGRFDEAIDELRGSTDEIEWSWEEALEWVGTLSGWWNKEKYRMEYQEPMPFGSPSDRIKRSTSKAVSALSEVFSHLVSDQDDEEGVESLQVFLVSLEEHGVPAIRLEAAVCHLEHRGSEGLIERLAEAMLHSDHDIVIDALLAARILAQRLTKQGVRGDFAPIGAMLVQGVQWRHRPALADRLRVVEDFVVNQPCYLSVEAVSGLLAGIGEIAKETATGIRGNDQDGVITIRAAAASLAFALFVYCQVFGLDEPESIRTWRELCGDPNEFSEVKNSWKAA